MPAKIEPRTTAPATRSCGLSRSTLCPELVEEAEEELAAAALVELATRAAEEAP